MVATGAILPLAPKAYSVIELLFWLATYEYVTPPAINAALCGTPLTTVSTPPTSNAATAAADNLLTLALQVRR